MTPPNGELWAYPRSMTLILGLSKPEGIYLSVDYRVTGKELVDGQERATVLDHAAVKHLRVDYRANDAEPGVFSSGQGPTALFAYTGLAEYGPRWKRTKIGDWLRETIRGEIESLGASLEHLKSRLDRDIAKFREGLSVGVLVIDGDRRYFLEISNLPSVKQPFEIKQLEPGRSFVIAGGSAADLVKTQGHLDRLEAELDIVRRKPAYDMKLLAVTNRRVAAADPEERVSPYCFVSFVSADAAKRGEQSSSRIYAEGSETVPFTMRHIHHGVDLSYMAESAFEAFSRGDLPVFDPEQMQRNIDRRP